jgi:hypothetical protein
MTRRICCLLSAVALGSCVVSTRLEAQTADERVFFTFSAPVELPGVGLPAGRYLFRLPDATNAHDVVQVLSADGKTVYGMFLTIPDERIDLAGRPEVRFMETRAGDPLPIRAYWMANQRTGYEFVYPKEQAVPARRRPRKRIRRRWRGFRRTARRRRSPPTPSQRP